uniref:Pre-mRNA-splicing factor SYF1 n=1 Tax=Buteo japonicus TaxID=224669 RepID=A0A8C0HJZ4_9AVES
LFLAPRPRHPEEEDVQHEEEILRNPFSVRCWLRYAQARQKGPRHRLNLLFERALRELPGSYKLWYQYLRQRRQQVKGRCPTDPAYEEANGCHERALMPRIWLDYCQFLVDQGRITRTRRTFDRALRALPITQHHRIWPLYLQFVRRYPLPETAVRVYRRYLKLSPESAEEYVEYLRSVGRLDEAAVRLARLVNDERFVSKEGKSNYQLWQELCELLSQHPERVRSLDAGAIIRGGLTRFTDQLGRLWGALADCYIRSGHFEKARDVYEEAVQTVMTVRDFTQVFDSYAQFEESVIAAKMETVAELGKEEDGEFRGALPQFPPKKNEFVGALPRFRPKKVESGALTVPSVPPNPDCPPQTLNVPQTSPIPHVPACPPCRPPQTLIVSLCPQARTILTKATRVRFRQVEDLAAVWCEFGEMELRHENYDEALRILRKATALPAKRAEYFDSTEPVQNRLYKSLKVWSMLADLEESLGTFQVGDAPHPVLPPGTHKPPMGSLPAPCSSGCPTLHPNVGAGADGCYRVPAAIYLLYAKLEEEFGLARHAMGVYERATRAVLPAQQHDMFNIYIKRAAELYGVTHTRPIYQKAIEVLGDDAARELCLRFADMECKLGEVD